jgi:hypothetical protein
MHSNEVSNLAHHIAQADIWNQSRMIVIQIAGNQCVYVDANPIIRTLGSELPVIWKNLSAPVVASCDNCVNQIYEWLVYDSFPILQRHADRVTLQVLLFPHRSLTVAQISGSFDPHWQLWVFTMSMFYG